GSTALIVAVLRGHETVIQSLLSLEQTDVNAMYSNGITALSEASHNGHQVIVCLILSHKGFSFGVHLQGINSFLIACTNGFGDIVKLFLAHEEIEINAIYSNGETALSIACKYGHPEILIKLVLSHQKVDINATISRYTCWYSHQYRVLTSACFDGHEEVVRLLLTYEDIDVNAVDLEDHTPLMIASTKGHEAIVKLLWSVRSDYAWKIGIRMIRQLFQVLPEKTRANTSTINGQHRGTNYTSILFSTI
ncbi:ankyrin repeat-containing domain protein, partial [Gymnopilus junonius]